MVPMNKTVESLTDHSFPSGIVQNFGASDSLRKNLTRAHFYGSEGVFSPS